MNDTLIKNWNSCISKQDTVYHLGDFSWTDPEPFLYQLNHKYIHVLLGNHDISRIKPRKYHIFTSVSTMSEIKINNMHITLCHYAMRTWNRSHFNAPMLYGHSHNTLPSQGQSFDVGVDTNQFKPYSLDDVIEKLKTLPNNINYIKDRHYEN
ncbi:MAG: metallophosphoesterase family protein [Candidatus Omnitrophica bacterium]|jgi:calcineurin-like phosphoesterase family protein|nr:metallophosphoesterase family protein [Candidatus Omnitrophota bacterium]